MTFVKRNAIYDEISARIKIRSRCNWCEFEEKSLLKFRKAQYLQKYSQTIISEKQEITDIHEINSHILNF